MSNIASEAKKRNETSNIFFTKEEPLPVQKSTKYVNPKSSISIFKEEPSEVPDNKLSKNYNKSDIFNVANRNQKIETTGARQAPSQQTDIFFRNSKKEKKTTNYESNTFDRHDAQFLMNLKKINPPEAFDKATILRPSGLLNNENNFDNKVKMKVGSDPNMSAKERKLVMNQSMINPNEVQVLKTKHSDVATLVEKVTSEALITTKVAEPKSKVFIDPNEEPVNENYKPSKKIIKKERINGEYGYYKDLTNDLDGGSNNIRGDNTFAIRDIENFKTYKIQEIEKEFRKKG